MAFPKVLIWRPEGENEIGHVAMKTDKYYVSIWPARFLKDGKHFITLLDGVKFMAGVEGSIVLNMNVDRENEGGCDPSVEYEIDVAVTNEDLNPIIEEFLRYNEINPEDVTLQRGEEPEQPQVSLLKTQYSFSAELLSGKKEEGESFPFYSKQQSCVSLIFNLLQVAWLKHHPDRPIPISNPDIIEGLPTNYLGENFYKVMWFDSVVQKYFMSTSNSYYRSFIVPGTEGGISVPFAIYSGKTNEKPRNPPIPITMSDIYFYLILYFVFFPILAIFSYFFPDFRYPVFFGMFVIIMYPFPMIHFVIGLFLMLLSYIYPVIPFISIMVFYVLYDYYTAFVEMQRSGKMKSAVELGLNLAKNWAGILGIGAVRKEIRTLRSQLKKDM